MFLKKHNIKLINRHSYIIYIQRLIEQANAIIKNKLQKWQVANSTRDWADILIKICKIINNKTYKSLFTRVTPF